MARRKRNAPVSGGLSPRPWLFGLVFLHLGLSPLLFSSATAEPFDYPKSVLLQLVSVLALAWMWAGAPRPGRFTLTWSIRDLPHANDPIAAGCLLFGVSAILSTVSSISPRTSLAGMPDSFAGLPTLLAGVALFFATRAACAGWLEVKGLLMAPVIAASVASSYALVQAAGMDAFSWARVAEFGGARPFGTLGNPNALSSFLAAVWPLQVCLSLDARRRGRILLSFALFASALTGALAIIRSASRAGWLGLAVGVAGVLFALSAAGEKRLAVRSLIALIAAALVAIAFAGLLPGGPELLATLQARAIGSTGYGSRRFLWTSALEIFRRHPFLGSGVDTFGLAFSPLRTPDFWALEWNTTFVRAHNEGFQVLATQGLGGAGALLTMGFGLAKAAGSAWRRLPREDRLVFGSTLAGISSLLPQMSVGLLYTAPAVLLITLTALVSATARVAEGPAAPRPTDLSGSLRLNLSRALAALAPVVLLLNAAAWQGSAMAQAATLGAFLLPLFLSFLIKIRSVEVSEFRPGESEASPDRPAVSRSSYFAAGGAGLVLGLIFTYPGVAANTALTRGTRLVATDPVAALAFMERATTLDPGSAALWARMGQSAQSMVPKDPAGGPRLRRRAREALDRAVALEPLAGQSRMLLCRASADQAKAGESTREVAALACDQAVQSEPFNPYFKTAAVNAAVQLGDLPRARRLAEAALASYPRLGPLLYQLGFIALQEARLQDAERALAAAIDGEWHGQLQGRLAASAALEEAHRRLGSGR